MRPRGALFLVFAAALFAIYARAVYGLQAPGQIVSPYGQAINARVVAERHATDAVSAVNFDYRGFDTLGEEFILFASVLGAVVLLRQQDEKRKGRISDVSRDRRVPEPSDAVRLWTYCMTGFTVLFGIYIVTHGQLSPGGGFQGGVILATAPLLIYLARSFEDFKAIVSHKQIELAESTGAAGFTLIGLGALLKGAGFLANVLPLGRTGDVFSGGTIPLISLTTGLEVAGGFVLLLTAFLQYAWCES